MENKRKTLIKRKSPHGLYTQRVTKKESKRYQEQLKKQKKLEEQEKLKQKQNENPLNPLNLWIQLMRTTFGKSTVKRDGIIYKQIISSGRRNRRVIRYDPINMSDVIRQQRYQKKSKKREKKAEQAKKLRQKEYQVKTLFRKYQQINMNHFLKRRKKIILSVHFQCMIWVTCLE